MAKILDLWGPYCTHLWKYLQCAYITRLMCIQGICFNKMVENLNFTSFWGPNLTKNFGFFYTHSKVAPTRLKMNIRENPVKPLPKIDENLYIDFIGNIWGHDGLEIWLTAAIFHTTKKQQKNNVPVNQVLWSHIKTFFGKWPKTLKFKFLAYFCNLRSLTKLKAHNQHSSCTTIWAISLCTFKPNIGKIDEKTREPI